MKKRNNHILIRHLDNRLQYSSIEYSWHWCKVKESLGKEEEAIWVGRKKVGKRRKKRRDQQEPLYKQEGFFYGRVAGEEVNKHRLELARVVGKKWQENTWEAPWPSNNENIKITRFFMEEMKRRPLLNKKCHFHYYH